MDRLARPRVLAEGRPCVSFAEVNLAMGYRDIGSG